MSLLFKSTVPTQWDIVTFKRMMLATVRAQVIIQGTSQPVDAASMDRFLTDLYDMYQGQYEYEPQTRAAIERGRITSAEQMAKLNADPAAFGFTPCQLAIAACVVDVFSVIFSFMGLEAAVQAVNGPIATKFAGTLTTQSISQFQTLMNAFKNATNATGKAWAIINIFLQAVKQMNVRLLASTITANWSVRDKLLMGAGIVCSLAAFVASGGTAYIVAVVNVLVSLTQLTFHLVDAVMKCSSSGGCPCAENISDIYPVARYFDAKTIMQGLSPCNCAGTTAKQHHTNGAFPSIPSPCSCAEDTAEQHHHHDHGTAVAGIRTSFPAMYGNYVTGLTF